MAISDAVSALERDLRGIFGERLRSLVVYGGPAPADDGHANAHHGTASLTHTLAVVERLSSTDLRSCAAIVASWHDAGLATPLIVTAHEFGRSLDAFPFEFGAILADHHVVSGSDPFLGLRVDPGDLRRACEVQARGHLLHLREGYLETRGRSDALAVLIVRSAGACAALITSLAHLDGVSAGDLGVLARHAEHRLGLTGTLSDIVALVDADEITSAEAERLFPPYLDAVERLVNYIDAWSR